MFLGVESDQRIYSAVMRFSSISRLHFSSDSGPNPTFY